MTRTMRPQGEPPMDFEALRTELRRLMRLHDVPGVALGILWNGRQVAGSAHRATRRRHPASERYPSLIFAWPPRAVGVSVAADAERTGTMDLVVGGTGLLGGAIALRLLERDHEVRVLLRRDSPADQLAQMGMATPASALLSAGAEAAYGDLKDPVSLRAAMRGVRRVITTANSALRQPPDTVPTIEFAGNRALVDAAAEAGVEHLVFMSALGADRESPVPFLAGKGATERYLRESGLGYTILAPDVFMEIWIPIVVGRAVAAREPVTLVRDATRRHSFVSMRDVVAYAVAALDHAAARDATLPIGGPAALTWREVVGVYERVLDRRIDVVLVAPGEPIPGVPDAMLPLLVDLEGFDSPIDMTEAARTFGIEPTPLEAVVRAMLPAM
jgi:uncharacterized protein YbjT (DUF2867 family)